MTKIDLQYDLLNYTPASASPVEANFDRIEQHTNQELIERDGTVAMRAQLRLVGDPVADLDATPKQYVDQVLPIGIIMMFGGAAAPPGGRWATCNGAELATATYPALFAVIGNNFSPEGTPAGRFHLPNLTDRMPLGNGAVAAIGATGGTKDAPVVPHTHSIAHTHGVHGHTGADHQHGDDHQHMGQTLGATARHQHGIGVGGGVIAPSLQGVVRIDTSGTPSGFNYVAPTATADDNIDHAHNFTTNFKSTQGYGTTTGLADRSLNTGTAMIALASGDSGAASGAVATAVNANLPPYLGVAYIVRII